MEFVSRTQRARSVEYRRPVSSQRSTPAQSSVFGVRSAAAAPTRLVKREPVSAPAPSVTQTSEHKVNSTHLTPHPHPNQPVKQHQATTAAGPQKPILATVPVYEAEAQPVTVLESAVVNEQNTPQDITSLFEKIELTPPVARRTATAYASAGKSKHSYEDAPSIKKRIFSAAVFVAATVGMVAMGYDLFVAPKAQPAVSNITAMHKMHGKVSDIPTNTIRVAGTTDYSYK